MKPLRMLFGCFTCFTLLVVSTNKANGQCSDYIDIGNPKRSVNYTIGMSDPTLCDDVTVKTPGAWYRFRQYTGEQMPEFCPEKGSCGTDSPIWMDGNHPTACSHTADCCTFSDPMKVTLCEEAGELFYVYQLPVVIRCQSAYCAGHITPCQSSEEWNPGLEMCLETTTTTSTTTTTTATTTTSEIQTTQSPSETTDKDVASSGNSFPTWGIVGLCLLSVAIGSILAGTCVYLQVKKDRHPIKIEPSSSDLKGVAASPPPPYCETIVEK